MKASISIVVECSAATLETMKRNGFSVRPDGSSFQVVVPPTTSIPKRKASIEFATISEDKHEPNRRPAAKQET